MRKPQILTAFFAAMMSLCFSTYGYCQQSTVISNGLQWLTSVQQTDGSWGDWSTPVARNTAVTAETFQSLAPATPAYTTALALQALKAANYTDTTILYQTLNYLTTLGKRGISALK